MRFNKKKFIYLISPPKIERNFFKDLNEVLKQKKTSYFQLRLKKGSFQKKLIIGRKIQKICKKFKVKFLINDDVYLAKKLNAATACSKPVSDAGWRPHHEHVGQTGLKISPKIYFAIGISGAIQHLAGVNSSKTIIVINNDPEAPFFKAADYGIVGDAFEVVPKIINSLG